MKGLRWYVSEKLSTKQPIDDAATGDGSQGRSEMAQSALIMVYSMGRHRKVAATSMVCRMAVTDKRISLDMSESCFVVPDVSQHEQNLVLAGTNCTAPVHIFGGCSRYIEGLVAAPVSKKSSRGGRSAMVEVYIMRLASVSLGLFNASSRASWKTSALLVSAIQWWKKKASMNRESSPTSSRTCSLQKGDSGFVFWNGRLCSFCRKPSRA